LPLAYLIIQTEKQEHHLSEKQDDETDYQLTTHQYKQVTTATSFSGSIVFQFICEKQGKHFHLHPWNSTNDPLWRVNKYHRLLFFQKNGKML